MRKQVLILGAGASWDYGLPLGSELKQLIVDRFNGEIMEDYRLGNVNAINRQEWIDFHGAFSASPLYIDQFTNIRRDNLKNAQRIANLAITYVLSQHEDVAKLNATMAPKENWYAEFWRVLNSGIQKKEEFVDRCKDITVITFNYDRSFELFLYRSITATYPELIDQAKQVEENLYIDIHHVYGVLESLKEIPYYSTPSLRSLKLGKISLINESRTSIDREAFLSKIREADTILFLGFSFQKENIELLGCPFNNDTAKPEVYGTCVGLYSDEVERHKRAIVTRPSMHGEFLINANCLEFIRRKFYIS